MSAGAVFRYLPGEGVLEVPKAYLPPYGVEDGKNNEGNQESGLGSIISSEKARSLLQQRPFGQDNFMQTILKRIQHYLQSRSPAFILSVGILLVLLIGVLHYETGDVYALGFLYLLPLFFVTWFAGKRASATITVLAILTWVIASLLSPQAPLNLALEIWNSGIELVGFTGFAVLISVLKGNGQKLDTTLSLLDATLDSTMDGIMVVDHNGKIESFNRKFLDMWGIPDTIVASRDDDQALAFVQEQLVRPEDFINKVRELYEKPEVESFDVLEFKDGRVFERLSLPQWVNGITVGRVWSFRDVTTRQRAEEELHASESELRALFAAIPDIILILDKAGRYLKVAPTNPRLLYMPAERIIGKTLHEVFPKEDADLFLDQIHTAFETGQPEHFEYSIPIQERTVWFSASVSPLADNSIIWVARDITEKKQAEALQNAVYQIATATETTRSLNDLYPRIHQIISSVMPAENFYITLFDELHETLQFPYNTDTADKPFLGEVLGGKGKTAYVLRTGKSLLCTRAVHEELVLRGDVISVGVPSAIWLGVPLIIEEKTIGVMVVQHYTDPNAYTEREQHMLEYVSTQVATAITRKLAETALQRQLKEITLLHNVSTAAEKTKSLEDLYPQIHEIISSVMPAENFYITLYDEEKDLLHFSYFKDAQDEPYLGEIQPGQGLTAYVLRTGKSLLCTQAVHNELERQGAVKLLGVPSAIWLGVPLVVEGKTIGAMVVQHYSDPQAYGEREQHMLEFVSTQVAIAINRKQAEKALETSEAELRALFAAMTEVVIVYDREGRYQEIAPTDPGLLIQSPNLLIGKSIYDFFPKNDADRLFQNIQTVLNMGIKMETEYSLKIGEYDRWFACTISPLQADTVLWVAHDITNRIQAEKVQAAIYEISRAAISTESIDELYVVIHTTLAELIHVENFFIALYDPSSDLISFPYYVDQYDEPPPANKPGRGLTEYVMRTMQPLLAPRTVFDELILRGEIEPVGTVSVDWLGVPLMVEGQVIGVMVTQSYQENIHFNQEDLHLFEFVSTQVAQMIDRKRVEEKIRYLGIHDSQTSLYNRAYFDEEMKRLDNGRLFPVSVLMADIDDLKGINDQEGHAVGDECLRLAAQALKAAFRTEDVVARIGGDEFAALLPGIDARMAGKAKQRIIDNIKKQNATRKGKPLQISMGVSTAEKIGSLVEALRLADDQMYMEKQSKEVAAHE